MRYFIAGNTGLVGSAICRLLEERGIDFVGASTKDVDFKNYNDTLEILSKSKPDAVVIAAAKVGGIKANNDFPVEFLSENILIATNLINASFELDIDKVIFLGSSCIYPKFAEQPIVEESLLTAPLEETNKAYAIAKIAGVELINSYRKQYGKNWFSIMPTNLYGINDNFDLEKSHVLPGMMRKIHNAKISGSKNVTLWGTGTVYREFMNSDDLADAILFLANQSPKYGLINVGVGSDIDLRSIANVIKDVVGFDGEIIWDTSMPDGTPKKLMDSSKVNELGWSSKIDLKEGLKSMYDWFLLNEGKL